MERLNSFWQDFSGGLHIRLTDSAVSTINEMDNRPTKCEIILRQTKDQQFELHRFALMADAGNLGMMSKVARHAVVQIVNFEQNPSFTKFELEIPVASFLSHSGKQGGVLIDNGTAHIPNHMSFHGQLKISLIQRQRPEKNWRIQGLSFEAECPHDYPDANSLVQSIKADWTGQAEVSEINLDHLALAATTEEGATAEPSQTGLWHSIAIRPIWFSSKADINSPESDDAAEFIRLQVAQAKELWAKALVRVDVVWQDPDRQTPFMVHDNSFLAEGMVVYKVSETTAINALASGHGVTAAELVLYNFNLKVGGSITIDPPNTPINVFVNIPTHTPNIGDANSKISGMADWLRAIHYWLSNSSDASLKPQLGVIDIYFTNFTDSLVQNQSEAIRLRGGGTTQSSNTAYAHCLLTDRRLPSRNDASKLRWMDYLLAHELGHVLGLKHPYDSDILSDGQLNIPKMTVKAFRWDPEGGGTQSYDCDNLPDSDANDSFDRVRMAHIMCLFDKVWTDRDFPIGIASNYSRNKTGDIMTEVVRKDPIPGVKFPTTKTTPTTTANTDYASALQTCLDKFIDQLTAEDIGEMDENPVLILFITDPTRNETDANINDYHMGMSFGLNARKSFAVPIYVINKAARRWTILGATVAFASDIYYFLNSPVMHKVDYGTLMDASTPDPAVIDLEMCNLIVNGNVEAVRQVGLVSINPALQLIPNKPTETFKNTKTFEMYIPSAKGDAGFASRGSWGNSAVEHSPYIWNRLNPLDSATLTRIRTDFFEPSSVIEELTHQPPKPNQTNYLYIHVRLRANHYPANLNSAGSLADYFRSKTRVFVGLRFPGTGQDADSILRLAENWYCEIVESITTDNSAFTDPPDAQAAKDAHPYVAGFTALLEWKALQLSPRFSLCAFVINADEALKNTQDSDFIQWQDVISPGWGINQMTVSDYYWVNISNTNLKWIWRNIDTAALPKNMSGRRIAMPPQMVTVNPNGAKLVYYIRRDTDAEAFPVYINRFAASSDHHELLQFDETGLARIEVRDSPLRPNIYGFSLLIDWEDRDKVFSLQCHPTLNDKVVAAYYYTLYSRADAEDEYARDVYATVKKALLNFNQYFQTNLADAILTSLQTVSSIDVTITELAAWSRQEVGNFAGLKTELQSRVTTQEMEILNCYQEFVDANGATDDYNLINLLNRFFEHLTFLIKLQQAASTAE